jgi:RNA polymerase II-associated protein 3
LDALNVKALFRRGQAMVGLDRLSDAQKGEHLIWLLFFSDGLVDFQEVLKLDPKNQAVKDELTKLTELTKKEKLKPRVVRY